MVDHTNAFFDRIHMQGNPTANPKSIVISGQARFTVLTQRMIRMEWSTTELFEDRATFAFPNREADVPEFSCKVDANELEITTKYLSLHYTANGLTLNAKNLSIEFSLNNQFVKWVPGMVNAGNLRGTRRTLDQCADAASLQEGLLSRDGWVLVDDSGSPVWNIDQRWIEERSETHVQDWYFLGYGHDYKATLTDYVRFGESIPLVPRYVLGLWWSRFWAYHANDLAHLADEFREHGIPLDVLVVDMDWHTPDAWTGYTWNRELFPDPEAFLAQMHAQNLYVTLNLHPAQGVQKHEEVYPRFAERLGHDPLLSEAIKFNSTDAAFVQNYFELLHHPLENQGVDFWWLDWQQGEATTIRNLDPLPWLNHLHFQDSTRRGKRPMLYSRWGGLGNHRYPIGFSGDTYATWESLRFQPYFTATAANVCYGWWSHDIGGHFGATDPELYARWVQFGAVSPCLRLHSTKDPLAERRPWAFPEEIYQATKSAIELRYKLFPYLYSAAQRASQQGLSLCYPMYYDYPEAEDAYLARSQYFLGDQLFVAPIVNPSDPNTGLASVDVWIPEGTWIEYTTQETFIGPKWTRIYGNLNRIPMFAKSGGLVPLAPPTTRTKEYTGEHLVLVVFPGADGQFDLYEDDGTTAAYRNGEFQTTSIRSTSVDDHTIAISIAGAEGVCTTLPKTRTIEVHLKATSKPDRIKVNSTEYTSWAYDENSRDLVFVLNKTDRQLPLSILIRTNEAVFAENNATQMDQAPKAVVAPVRNGSGDPLLHVIDYATFEDARQQLGTIIVVPPVDDSSFDVEIKWTLDRGGIVSAIPLTLKGCHARQVLHSPFLDGGSLTTFRWTVQVNVFWRDRSLQRNYQSPTAYPSVNHWQELVFNSIKQAYEPQTVVLSDNTLNPTLPWQPVAQSLTGTLYLQQPFGVVLLEQEKHRISAGEPLEAYLTTALFSQLPQEVILCMQSVGDTTCFLNGIKLGPTEPIKHEKLGHMFYSWMPPVVSYFTLSLQTGSNRLLLLTKPNTSTGWWGIGATVFNSLGQVLTEFNGTLR